VEAAAIRYLVGLVEIGASLAFGSGTARILVYKISQRGISARSPQLIYAVAADDIRRHNSKEMPPVWT
jgi:hypothetical protein